jgi:hypothetical protein
METRTLRLVYAGTDDAPALPDTDKYGNPRIIGEIVEMGAYEFVE